MNDAGRAALLAACTRCPYDGEVRQFPFEERETDGASYALVAVDPGLSALGLRGDDGSLWYLPEGAAPRLVNSSVEAFIAFNHAFEEAAAEAEAYEAPEDDEHLTEDETVAVAEQAADRLTESLLKRFRSIDTAAVTDENSFWHIAAEELGYGMDV